MRRLGLVAAALMVLSLSGGARAAHADGVTYACSSTVPSMPPKPATAANCDGWHTTSVTLYWSSPAGYVPADLTGNDCSSPHPLDTDTTGTKISCAVWDGVSFATITGQDVTIRIDKTPPTVTGFTPDRQPDHDGWFNHPVGLQFTGTDATSQIAGCDLVAFSGPEGANASATGGCRDNAGNASTSTFPIKYDATPPMVAALPATTAVGLTTLNWTTSADTVQTRIDRSPGIGGAPESEIYSGPDHMFTDSGVTGGTTYRYTLTATDQAANAAATSIDVAAKRPAVPKRAAQPPRLRWRRVKGADYYNMQLYRGNRKVLSVWPRLNRFQLRRNWTFRGHKRKLAPGTYHWYVWPGFGRRAHHRYGKLISHRRFTIPEAR